MTLTHGLGHCPEIHRGAAIQSALQRRCPRCRRKGALKKPYRDAGWFECRYGCRGWWTRLGLEKVRARLRRWRARKEAQ